MSKLFTRRYLFRIGAISAVTSAACVPGLAFAEDKTNQQKLGNQKIVVIGGGSAGIGVSAMLLNEGATNVTIIEPASVHYYQPLWTLCGTGIKNNRDSARPMEEVIPKKSKWLKQGAKCVDPMKNIVTLSDGSSVPYDYLIVAPGIKTNWDMVPGLVDALHDEKSGVVSIYDFNYSDKAYQAIQNFNGGRAIFTVPATPVKCPGAVQKIMWLFEEYISDAKDKTLRSKSSVELWSAGEAIFGVKKYADMLEKERVARNVITNFKMNLIAVDGVKKIATFKNTKDGSMTEVSYDLLHVSPPMGAVDFLKGSAIANEAGFVLVDSYTMQSQKFPNIFALGDCSSTANSKTVAAVTSQAPVVVHNLKQLIQNEPLNGVYNGYASCPLVVGKDRVILAEFGYGGKIMETFDSKTGKFPYSLIGQEGAGRMALWAFFKKEFFPFVYWNMWVKGHWFGNSGPFKPDVTKTAK